MIHVGGDDEPILSLEDVPQGGVGPVILRQVPVEHDVSAPVRPVLLRGGVALEGGGVHVAVSVLRDEVGEVGCEPLPPVLEAGGRGQPCAGPDEYRVRSADPVAERVDAVVGADARRSSRQRL